MIWRIFVVCASFITFAEGALPQSKVHLSINKASSSRNRTNQGPSNKTRSMDAGPKSLTHGNSTRVTAYANGTANKAHGSSNNTKVTGKGTAHRMHGSSNATKVTDKSAASGNRTFRAKSCSSACIDCKLNRRATSAADAALGQPHYCCYQYYQAGDCEASAMLAPKPGSTPCGGESPNVNCLDGRYR
eukprot:gnl/MRDRNA2_/MRDRNA2_88933_c0_seq1.p1 gnl/MRDRNA2_/MRDRNA2_88933_c0~~gnl/MRDRNA2_/MRDRNA2_88933_c0_seq1.p1  ORF type:complete len:188 (-),score=27.44 gnl/MRDRNA2_/MRDRNA2_88933_c0_seq1:220-783(-)